MPDPKSDGAKPAQETAAKSLGNFLAPIIDEVQARRDRFAIAFASALLTRKDRTPLSLAREVVTFTDAFLAELDRKVEK